MTGPHGLFTGKVKVRAYSGKSSTATFWHPPVEVAARVEFGNKLVRSSGGTEIVSQATVFLAPWTGLKPSFTDPPDGPLDVRSRVMLPDDEGYSTTPTTSALVGRTIANASLVRDERDRQSHLEIALL